MLLMTGTVMARETETTASQLTIYPAFRGVGNRIEAIIDKGLMLEYIIGCSGTAGIVTFSKIEGLYCTPDHRCSAQLRLAVLRLC